MRQYWTEGLCHTAVFIICAQVLVHFRPNGSYEKYMKMLVSAMILIQLIGPVSVIFTGDGDKSLKARAEWFEGELEKSMEQAAAEYEERARQLEQTAMESLTEQILWGQAADESTGQRRAAEEPTEQGQSEDKLTGQERESGEKPETEWVHITIEPIDRIMVGNE